VIVTVETPMALDAILNVIKTSLENIEAAGLKEHEEHFRLRVFAAADGPVPGQFPVVTLHPMAARASVECMQKWRVWCETLDDERSKFFDVVMPDPPS
jgi:hypothetical protein